MTFLLFRKFVDRGYIFSKIFGILIASYAVWIAGSLHVASFSLPTIIGSLVVLAGVNVVIWKKYRHVFMDKPIPWYWIIAEEFLFFITLWFWSYIRANEPSIHGLEKFMDYGFVNSILRANYFPPLDMWLTKSPDYTGGYFINYYYYGHYIAAFLTKISGIDSAVTYNLMIATLFAFTFTLPFSIGITLAHSISRGIRNKLKPISSELPRAKLLLLGILFGFIVSMGGNLHTLYVFTNGYPNETPQPPWNVEWGFHPEKYWYPNATRFIPFTIHEFPIYSFVVADLHGHVSDIPFVLFTLAILLTLILPETEISSGTASLNSSGKSKLKSSDANNILEQFKTHTQIPLPIIGLLGLLLAVMYMTNAWDGLIYMGLTGLVILLINGHLHKPAAWKWQDVIYRTFSAALFLVFFFFVTSLPFMLNFQPFASSVGFLCSPKFLEGKSFGPLIFEQGKCQKSPLYMLAILWGFFYFNVIFYFFIVTVPTIKKRFFHKISSFIPTLYPTDYFILLLILLSTGLLIFPEFFYLKDIYPAHYRANTMFKLGYQAFMMLGLVSAYAVYRIRSLSFPFKKPKIILIYTIGFLCLFGLIAIYPNFAINSYYGELKTYKGLYGLNWFSNQYPDDYKAALWLRSNIQCTNSSCDNQPVIVEAVGDSYTDYARFSANTGLPTIVGWPVHEWLWRKTYDEAGRRIPEVTNIYESSDETLTKSILKKYNASYIIVGTLEREKYKLLKEDKIQKLGTVVFESGTTKIYKLNSF